MKKILVVTQSPPSPNAVGVPLMLWRLFSTFPEGTTTFLASDEAPDDPFLRGRKEYRFFAKDLIKPQSWWARSPMLKYTAVNAANFLGQAIRIAREGGRLLATGGVDEIVGISDTGPCFLASWWLSRKFKVPYSILVFDLWRGNFLKPADRLAAFLFEKNILRGARKILTAGEGLAEHLKEQYALAPIVVHNPLPRPAESGKPVPPRANPPFILYPGSVYWAQEDSVRNLVSAIRGLPVELRIYTPQPASLLEEKGIFGANVHVLPQLSSQETARVEREAAVLFLPLSFARHGWRVIQTASPGKMSEYLAAGRPILVHAPPYAFISRYTKMHACALVVETPSPAALKEAVLRLLRDKPLVQTLTSNARRLAHERYSLIKNAEIVKANLLS